MNRIKKNLRLAVQYLSMIGWKVILSSVIIFAMLLTVLSVVALRYNSVVRDVGQLMRVNGKNLYFSGLMADSAVKEKVRNICRNSSSVSDLIERDMQFSVSSGSSSYDVILLSEEYYGNIGIACRGKGLDYSSEEAECIVPQGYVPGIRRNDILKLTFTNVPTDDEKKETVILPLKVSGICEKKVPYVDMHGGGTVVKAQYLVNEKQCIFIKKTEKTAELFSRAFGDISGKRRSFSYTSMIAVRDDASDSDISALVEELRKYGQVENISQIIENSRADVKEDMRELRPILGFAILFSLIILLCSEVISYLSNAEEIEIWRRIGADKATVRTVVAIGYSFIWGCALVVSCLFICFLGSGIIEALDTAVFAVDSRTLPALLATCLTGIAISIVVSDIITRNAVAVTDGMAGTGQVKKRNE